MILKDLNGEILKNAILNLISFISVLSNDKIHQDSGKKHQWTQLLLFVKFKNICF